MLFYLKLYCWMFHYIVKKPRWRQQCHKWSFSFLEVHVPVTDSPFRTYSLFNIGIAHSKWKIILYWLNYLTKQTTSVIHKFVNNASLLPKWFIFACFYFVCWSCVLCLITSMHMTVKLTQTFSELLGNKGRSWGKQTWIIGYFFKRNSQ